MDFRDAYNLGLVFLCPLDLPLCLVVLQSNPLYHLYQLGLREVGEVAVTQRGRVRLLQADSVTFVVRLALVLD